MADDSLDRKPLEDGRRGVIRPVVNDDHIGVFVFGKPVKNFFQGWGFVEDWNDNGKFHLDLQNIRLVISGQFTTRKSLKSSNTIPGNQSGKQQPNIVRYYLRIVP